MILEYNSKMSRQEFIQRYINDNKSKINVGEISDGYHTFDELYYHRMVLFSLICNQNHAVAWKSCKHHDGTMFDDYFIVGIETAKGDYTYHYHKDYWELFQVSEVPFAPEWDGHKPSDIDRLFSILT